MNVHLTLKDYVEMVCGFVFPHNDCPVRSHPFRTVRREPTKFLFSQPLQKLNIPQPRVSELMTGKVDRFSADKLIGFLARVGIRLKPAPVHATRRRPFGAAVVHPLGIGG